LRQPDGDFEPPLVSSPLASPPRFLFCVRSEKQGTWSQYRGPIKILETWQAQ
jgi:hypothetical protein